MKTRVFLNNEHWLVTLKSFMGQGAIKITLKRTGEQWKSSLEEKAYLSLAINTLKASGIPIENGNDTFDNMVESFAAAVASRGEARWEITFRHTEPADFAKEHIK